MSHRILSAVAVTAGCLLIVGNAWAESRLALVIGNSDYQSVARLANPANDANAVSKALQAADFEVQTLTDLTRLDMGRALSQFANRVGAKGKDTVVLVFYAGHGLQIEGENYLVPTNAKIEREADVPLSTMRLADVMKALESVPSKMRIVILDACRNNPFTTLQKTGGRGLAIVDAPAGSIVAYSTSPGAEALDGTSANSPYTSALVEVMKEPGLPIEQVFKGVRVKVNKNTDGRQVPWESSSLTANFAFLPAVNPIVAVNAPAKPEPAAVGPTSVGAPVQIVSGQQDFSAVNRQRVSEIAIRPVAEAYQITIEENSIEAFDEFIKAYEEDPRAAQIKRLLTRRNQMVAWRNAVVSNDPQSYDAYLSLWPDSDHAAEATRLRERPRFRPIDPVIARAVVLPLSNRLQFGNGNNVINQAINRLGGNRGGNFPAGGFDRNANNRLGSNNSGFPNRGQNTGSQNLAIGRPGNVPSGSQAGSIPSGGRPGGINANLPTPFQNNTNVNNPRAGGINQNAPAGGQTNVGNIQNSRPAGINPSTPVGSPFAGRGQQQVTVPQRAQQPQVRIQQRSAPRFTGNGGRGASGGGRGGGGRR
jgi:hypothetical protein